jgi:O-antigen/teichoic acid export membrane protein
VGGALLFFARRDRQGGATVSSGLVLVATSSSLAAAGAGLAMTLIPHLLPRAVPVSALLLALIAVVPVNITGVGRQALLSGGDLIGVAGMQALQAIAVLGLVGGALVLWSPQAMVALLAYSVAQILVAGAILGRLKGGRPIAAPVLGVMRGLLTSGFQMHVGTVALFLAYRCDILLVNHFLGPAAAGVYSIALTVSELIRAIPEFGQLSVYSGSADGKIPNVGQTARITVLATVVASCLMAVVNFWAVPLLFGPAFARASVAFLAFLPGLLGLAVSYMVSPLLVLRGRMLDTSAAAVLSLGLMLVLDVVTIPAWGIVGAAGASSVAYVSLAALQWHAASRIQPVSCWALVPRRQDLALLQATVVSLLRPAR